MANEVKLEVYTYAIREKNSKIEKANYLPLNDIESNDVLDFFSGYIKSLDSFSKDEGLKKTISINTPTVKVNSKARTVSGIFESGAYGLESKIRDVDNYKLAFTKTIKHADVYPFYFLISVPENRNVGIIILQRIGHNGISTIFKSSLNSFFKTEYLDFSLDFSPLISKELAKAFIQDGGVKEIILRKFNLPADRADKVGMKKYRTQVKELQIRIKAKTFFRGFNGDINSYLKDPNAKFFDIPALRELGFDDGFKISVRSELNGNTRTVDLTESMELRPYYDIDSLVTKEDDGHPKLQSIDREARTLLAELSEELRTRK